MNLQMIAPNYGDAYEMMVLNILPDIVEMLKDIFNSPRVLRESFIEDLLWRSNPNP